MAILAALFAFGSRFVGKPARQAGDEPSNGEMANGEMAPPPRVAVTHRHDISTGPS